MDDDLPAARPSLTVPAPPDEAVAEHRPPGETVVEPITASSRGPGHDPSQPALCQLHPLSNVGLARLAATHPEQWRAMLREHLDELTSAIIDGGAADHDTINTVLLRHCGDLLPAPSGKAGVGKVLRARQLVGAVVEHAGDLAACEVDAEALEELRYQLLATQHPRTLRLRSSDRVGRAISLTREALCRWRAAQNLEIIAMKRTNRHARRRDGNYSLPLRAVHEMIRRARPTERALIALAVSAGLLDRETRQLDRRDFHNAAPRDGDALQLFVRVVDADDIGLERWIALPRWVQELLNAMPHKGDTVFPPGSAPALGQTIRRLRRPDDEVWITPRALRSTYQAVARTLGGSRELVRGTWRQRAGTWPDRWHPAQLEQWKLCLRWDRFVDGPGVLLLDKRVIVPRRAPAHCLPGAPERSPRKKRPAPLPPGMGGLPARRVEDDPDSDG